MPVVASIGVGSGSAEVDFTVNASNVVTGITIRNTLPTAYRAVKVFIRHAGSGYTFDSELVFGGAPITISVPNARRFPNDNTADVAISTDVRTVSG